MLIQESVREHNNKRIGSEDMNFEEPGYAKHQHGSSQGRQSQLSTSNEKFTPRQAILKITSILEARTRGTLKPRADQVEMNTTKNMIQAAITTRILTLTAGSLTTATLRTVTALSAQNMRVVRGTKKAAVRNRMRTTIGVKQAKATVLATTIIKDNTRVKATRPHTNRLIAMAVKGKNM